jgi:hypothetical protein
VDDEKTYEELLKKTPESLSQIEAPKKKPKMSRNKTMLPQTE